MSKLEDTQNQPDERRVPIKRVGIRDLSHPILFTDGEAVAQATVATVAMSVALSADVRGTHMSRFVSILSEHADGVSVPTLPKLLDVMIERLTGGAEPSKLTYDDRKIVMMCPRRNQGIMAVWSFGIYDHAFTRRRIT